MFSYRLFIVGYGERRVLTICFPFLKLLYGFFSKKERLVVKRMYYKKVMNMAREKWIFPASKSINLKYNKC